MGYSYVPKEALPVFITTLCRVVNMEKHCEEAWRIMSSLMATHLGHSALLLLCETIQVEKMICIPDLHILCKTGKFSDHLANFYVTSPIGIL